MTPDMIFFDLDGTLIDSNGVWLQVDHDFLGRRGLQVTEEYQYVVGHSIFPVAAQFTKEYYHLPDDPQTIMDEWQAMARNAYAHTIPLKPGARELLDKLQAEGRPMALLTAGLPALAMAAVERHGLERYFCGLFFAQEAGLEKRDPQVYRMAAERFAVPCQGCVLLEDAPHNCAAAASVGFQVVGVYDDFYAKQWEDIRKSCHLAVKSLTELL